jgi:hypothetical protein
MVEKWQAITFEYSDNEKFDGELRMNSSWVKKGIVLCLGGDKSMQ